VPYAASLAQALAPTQWSVFNLLLSSSYTGWGVGSLDKDVEEIGACVDFVRQLRGEGGKVVVMGHSTGSQDVLHYLYSELSQDHGSEEQREKRSGGGRRRPVLDGAIMQAPVSDRESLLAGLRSGSHPFRTTYDQLVNMAKTQPITKDGIDSILPLSLTAVVGFPSDTPLSARRFLSLASPDSPGQPLEDDLFSSDLDDQQLKGTFGVVGERGLLRSKLLVLYSGADEHAAPWVDKEALMKRWAVATDTRQPEKWDHEGSAVIPGASHNVKDVGQDELIARVTGYLNRVEQG
jgi:hypothetical protein